MDRQRRRRLQRTGWRVGDAAAFLELSPAEAEFVELKVALARGLRARREQEGLTQKQVARQVGSSQSRVAKMEGADDSVSVDFLIRALLALGASRAEIARLVRTSVVETRAV